MLSRGTTTLRPAHISEAPVIARMSRLLVEHGLRWRWTSRRVRQSIRDKETMVLVATTEGALIGFAIMKFGDEESHLHLLAVEPRYRREGVATEMLDWLETTCRTAGLQQIRLEVRAGNEPARQFYSRQGYEHLGDIIGYYDGVESAAVLGKRLALSGTGP